MILKDIFGSKTVRYTIFGIGITTAALIGTKLLYDYSIYNNLKYVKKRLDKMN
jgi:hypothetical protein